MNERLGRNVREIVHEFTVQWLNDRTEIMQRLVELVADQATPLVQEAVSRRLGEIWFGDDTDELLPLLKFVMDVQSVLIGTGLQTYNSVPIAPLVSRAGELLDKYAGSGAYRKLLKPDYEGARS